MKNEYIMLNAVQSHIITWGSPFHNNGNDVIVCITGNPGITDFYTEFGTQIYKITGLSLCIIGHAGHEEVPDKRSNCLKKQEDLFNLKGQVLHKLDLINNYIDKESRLHIIGHSIGSWITLEMLQNDVNLNSRVASLNMLFPTWQRMAVTKNGKYLNNIIRRCHAVIMLLFLLVKILPQFIIYFLAELYLKLNSLPSSYLDRTLKFLNPKVGEKVLYLAYNEMDVVKKLNIKALDSVKHLTNVIYSSNDNWAPVHFMDDLKVFQPFLQMKQVDIDHAFVLKSSEIVANMVSAFITERIIKM